MSSRHRTKAVGFVVAVGLAVLGSAGVAAAHHPEVEARAVCLTADRARIVVTASSWVVDDISRKTNPDIAVTVGGQTKHGAFDAANGFGFQVSFDVPADGARYVVRATSVAAWGFHGEWGSVGEYRETAVTVPTACPDSGGSSVSTSVVPPASVPNGITVATTIPSGSSSTVTSSTTSTTSTTAPVADEPGVTGQSVVGAPSSGSSSVVVTVPDDATKAPLTGIDGGVLVAPSTIETKVIGTVETLPVVEVKGAVQFPQLPRTGTDPRPYLALGVTLATVGVLLDSVARRRRPADVAD